MTATHRSQTTVEHRRIRPFGRGSAVLVAAGVSLATAGCAPVPKVKTMGFEVDVDEIRDPVFLASVDEVITSLEQDPALHVHIVGHADEDNTEEYNFALSRRRAEHVRSLILERRVGLATRITTSGRGELDPLALGETEEVKRANRRVEFVFFYPRQCQPTLSADFIACEYARIDPPPPPPAPVVEQPAAPPEAPEEIEEPAVPAARRGLTGGYVFGGIGYGVGIKEFVRHHVNYGVGGGALWAFGGGFRLAAGLEVDGFSDQGFIFTQTQGCGTDCGTLDRDYYRAVPEVRIGVTRGRLWAYGRIAAGIVFQVPEDGELAVGGNFGGGLGLSISVWRGLYLGLDFMLSNSRFGGIDGGQGLYDAKLLLGWRFAGIESW